MYFLQTGILMMISMQVDALTTNLSEHGAPLNDLPIEDTHARENSDSCQITGESKDLKKDHEVIVLDTDSSNEASPVKIDAQPIKIEPIENAGTLGVPTDMPMNELTASQVAAKTLYFNQDTDCTGGQFTSSGRTLTLAIENAYTPGVDTQSAVSESAVDEPVLPIPFKTPDNQANVNNFGDSPQQVPTSVLKRNLLAIKMELQDREDEEVRACIQRTGSVQSDETEVFSGDEAVADSLNVD
jgi:hypothetical protein